MNECEKETKAYCREIDLEAAELMRTRGLAPWEEGSMTENKYVEMMRDQQRGFLATKDLHERQGTIDQAGVCERLAADWQAAAEAFEALLKAGRELWTHNKFDCPCSSVDEAWDELGAALRKASEE
jgi:hypothetical protein